MDSKAVVQDIEANLQVALADNQMNSASNRPVWLVTFPNSANLRLALEEHQMNSASNRLVRLVTFVSTAKASGTAKSYLTLLKYWTTFDSSEYTLLQQESTHF